jgi:glycine oxidase
LTARNITVVGAGITGLWQALTLARRGHRVRLIEASASADPFSAAASRFAGAMLAPYCEEEGTEPVIRELGLEAKALWQSTYPGVVSKGTIVVAAARDRSELTRLARMTEGHETIDAAALARLEPDLAGRFQTALYYADEAHMSPVPAMTFLLQAARKAGVDLRCCIRAPDDAPLDAFDDTGPTASVRNPARKAADQSSIVIDCRGLGARGQLPKLRGVRGERLIVRAPDIRLQRPVRLLHPRHPVYVVPWGGGSYMIGATVIESEDVSRMTLRSAMELMGLAYALLPAFGEAEIVDFGAGLRPSFPNNVPQIIARGPRIFVNGAYRHGFLLAPALARITADLIETGARDNRIVGGD